MNHKQNNYLSVPTITKSSSPSNTEDIDMISDGSQSPYFSTDDNSTMSYDNIQYNQSNHSSNSQYTQVIVHRNHIKHIAYQSHSTHNIISYDIILHLIDV